jgi:hypothetical protein
VELSTLHAFQPLAVIGTAWITLVIGVGFGVRDGRRISLRGIACGVALSVLTAVSVAALSYVVLQQLWGLSGDELLFLSSAVGIVGSETTRHAVRWVFARHGAEGPLSVLVAESSEIDNIVPLTGVALLFPLIQPPAVSRLVPIWGWLAITPILGVLLGGTAAALLRAEPRASDGWGVIIGAALLGTGIASRLGLAPQAVTFAIGISLALLSRHRGEVRAMLARSEQAVLLPVLMLSGAEIEVKKIGPMLALFAAALTGRLAARLLLSPVFVKLSGAPKSTAPPLAVGLLPSGAVSVTLGLAFESRYPGAIGDTVLAISACLAVAGEVVGPSALRRALAGAGEITVRGTEATRTPTAAVAEGTR